MIKNLKLDTVKNYVNGAWKIILCDGGGFSLESLADRDTYLSVKSKDPEYGSSREIDDQPLSDFKFLTYRHERSCDGDWQKFGIGGDNDYVTEVFSAYKFHICETFEKVASYQNHGSHNLKAEINVHTNCFSTNDKRYYLNDFLKLMVSNIQNDDQLQFQYPWMKYCIEDKTSGSDPIKLLSSTVVVPPNSKGVLFRPIANYGSFQWPSKNTIYCEFPLLKSI